MDAPQRAAEHLHKRSWLERLSLHAPAGAQGNGFATTADFLPSFFVVGPPRTGTSWLHDILRGQAVLPSPTKETRFFDTHFHRGIDWYRAHYPAKINSQTVGEIAPTYFASDKARQRIAQLLPEARVVCIFRDPVERILSLYRVKRAYGLIPSSFEHAVVHDPEFMETSRYTANLRAWQNTLGRDQVMVTLYDDLQTDPQTYLDSIVDFIGIPRFTLTAAQNHSVHGSDSLTHPRNYARTRNATRMADWLKAQRLDKLVAAVRESPLRKLFLGGGRPFAEPSPELTARLYELFRPEVEELEKILQRDLSTWKSLKAVAA
jgi:hypothetical protein